MKKLLISLMILLVVGCSSPLSTITDIVKPDTGITAQVGASNTKQGLGVNSNVDKSIQEEMKNDIKGDNNTVASSHDKGIVVKDAQRSKVSTSENSQSTGTITADKVNVTNGSVWPVVAIGLGSLVIVLAFILVLFWRSSGRLKSIDKENQE